MRWSIRIFNIPPPRATPCVQIPAPWGQNCVQIPTQVLDLIKNFFVKGKISNPDQFLSTLSPRPSAFCLWKWIQVQNWTSPASLITSCFSAKNEALHAFSIQEVTSLADSYDSPLICADMEVSIKKEFLITQHTEMQTDETYLCVLYVK